MQVGDHAIMFSNSFLNTFLYLKYFLFSIVCDHELNVPSKQDVLLWNEEWKFSFYILFHDKMNIIVYILFILNL